MPPLPTLSGHDVVAELGFNAYSRRYRLGGPERDVLVHFDHEAHRTDKEAGQRLALECRAWTEGASVGFAPVREVLEQDGSVWLVCGPEIEPEGPAALRVPALGEQLALPILKDVASALAEILKDGRAHGALLPGGVFLSADGQELETVLPSVVVESWLAALAGEEEPGPVAPGGPVAGFEALAPAGRDLSALGLLSCHLIAGLTPTRAAGVGALPEALKGIAAPATAHAVRLMLEQAGTDLEPQRAAELLARVKWARGVKIAIRRPAAARPAAARRSAARTSSPPPAATTGQKPGSRRPGGEGTGEATSRPRRSQESEEAPPPRSSRSIRLPAWIGLGAVVLIVGGLLAFGGLDAISEYRERRERTTAVLPQPVDPMARGDVTSAGTPNEPVASDEEVSAPPPEIASSAPGSDQASTDALADQILRELKERQAKARQGKPPKPTPTYDRTAIDAGDELRLAAIDILRDVRDKKVPHSKKNQALDRAIQKLESAREKYQSFAEQYPSKERLVESKLTDVISLLRGAHKSRSR